MADVFVNIRLNDNGALQNIQELQNMLRDVESRQHTISINVNSESFRRIQTAFSDLNRNIIRSSGGLLDGSLLQTGLDRAIERLRRARINLYEAQTAGNVERYHIDNLNRAIGLVGEYQQLLRNSGMGDFNDQLSDSLSRINGLATAFRSIGIVGSAAIAGLANGFSSLSSAISTILSFPGVEDLSKLFSSSVGTIFSEVSSSINKGLSGGTERYDILQTFPKVLQGIGYSAQQASSSTERLRDSILGLPVSLNEVTENAQYFTLLTNDLEKATDLTIALNNGFVASGASSEQISTGIRVFSYLLEGATLTTRQWQSLVRSMPVLLRYVGESMGYTRLSEFTGELRAGNIDLKELQDRIIDVGLHSEKLTNLLDVFKGKVSAALTNVGIAAQRFGETFISGLNKAIAYSGHDGLVGFLRQLQQLIDSIGNSLERSLISKSSSIGQLIDRLFSIDWGRISGGVIDGLIEKLDRMVSWIETGANISETWLGNLIIAGETLSSSLSSLSSLVSTFSRTLGIVGGGTSIYRGLADIGSTGFGIGANVGATRAILRATGASSSTIALATISPIVSAIVSLIPVISEVGSMIYDSINGVGDRLIDEVRALNDGEQNALVSLATGLQVGSTGEQFSNIKEYVSFASSKRSQQIRGLLEAMIEEENSIRATGSHGAMMWLSPLEAHDLMSHGETLSGANSQERYIISNLSVLPRDVVVALSYLSGKAVSQGQSAEWVYGDATNYLSNFFTSEQLVKENLNAIADIGSSLTEYMPEEMSEVSTALTYLVGMMDDYSEEDVAHSNELLKLMTEGNSTIELQNKTLSAFSDRILEITASLEEIITEAIKNTPKTSDLFSIYKSGGVPEPYTTTTRPSGGFGWGTNTSGATLANTTTYANAFTGLFDQMHNSDAFEKAAEKFALDPSESAAVENAFYTSLYEALKDPSQDNFDWINQMSENFDEFYEQAVENYVGLEQAALEIEASYRGIDVEDLIAERARLEEATRQVEEARNNYYTNFGENLLSVLDEWTTGSLGIKLGELFSGTGVEDIWNDFYAKLIENSDAAEHTQELQDAQDNVAEFVAALKIRVETETARPIETTQDIIIKPRVIGRNWDGVSGPSRITEASGGQIPSFGTDTVPAMLTPGEYVHRRAVVQHYGKAFMDRINNLDLQGALATLSMSYATPYATGGFVRADNRSYRDNHASIVQNFNNSRSDYSLRRANRFLRSFA